MLVGLGGRFVQAGLHMLSVSTGSARICCGILLTRTLQVSQGSQGACLIGTLHQASPNGYQTRISLYCTSLQGHLIDTYSIQSLSISSQRSSDLFGAVTAWEHVLAVRNRRYSFWPSGKQRRSCASCFMLYLILISC